MSPRVITRAGFSVIITIVGFEAEQIGSGIVRGLNWTQKKGVHAYLDMTKYVIFGITSVINVVCFTFYPETNLHTMNVCSLVFITIFHTVALLWYIKYQLKEDCSNETLNDELAKATVLRCAIDILNNQWVVQLVGCLYTDLSLTKSAAFFVLAIDYSWWSESGGYLFGKNIGGPKFSYFISPNKTWAGFWGQFGGSALAHLTYLLVTSCISREEGWLQWSSTFSLVSFMILVSLASIFGDLFESLYKRASGTKDSNTTFSNFTHGGALDKWDSLGYCIVIIHIWVANGWLY